MDLHPSLERDLARQIARCSMQDFLHRHAGDLMDAEALWSDGFILALPEGLSPHTIVFVDHNGRTFNHFSLGSGFVYRIKVEVVRAGFTADDIARG